MIRRTSKAALLFVIAVFTTTLTLAQTPAKDPASDIGVSMGFIVQEPYEINGTKGTRYKLSVTNRASYPDFLLRPTQPPATCGKNQNASRTWVEVFGSPGDQRLAGFCGFRSSEDLGHLWFDVPAGEKGPPCVYLVMTDRQTGKKYESNQVCSRIFTISTGTLKGNVKPAAGKTKGFEGNKGWIEIGSTQLDDDKPATRPYWIPPVEWPEPLPSKGRKEKSQGNQAVTGRAVDPIDSTRPGNKMANPGKPDLLIEQFLFPPTNEKALRVHVVNQGNAASAACRLVLTVRKINGVAVGRTTHVNVPALAVGADAWFHIDARSILPNNISLESTTFKVNVDGTEIVAESNEANNEVWHNEGNGSEN